MKKINIDSFFDYFKNIHPASILLGYVATTALLITIVILLPQSLLLAGSGMFLIYTLALMLPSMLVSMVVFDAIGKNIIMPVYNFLTSLKKSSPEPNISDTQPRTDFKTGSTDVNNTYLSSTVYGSSSTVKTLYTRLLQAVFGCDKENTASKKPSP